MSPTRGRLQYLPLMTGGITPKTPRIRDGRKTINNPPVVYESPNRLSSFLTDNKMKIISYKRLLEVFSKENDTPKYSNLLTTKEWLEKREEIVKRDNYACTKCNTKSDQKVPGMQSIYIRPIPEDEYLELLDDIKTHCFSKDIEKKVPKFTLTNNPVLLQVHHTYYSLDKLPWEYENKSLITLCSSCHLDFHLNNTVPVYDKNNEVEVKFCDRCGGTGYLPEYHYYCGGVCFKCDGNRFFRING